MSRFDRFGLRRFSARQAVVAVTLAAVLLVLFEGAAIRKQGEEMHPGIQRDLVLAVGRPAGWVADRLPLRSVAHTLTAWLSPNQRIGKAGSFTSLASSPLSVVPPVSPDAFDPSALGAKPPPRRPLRTLLVTGDSMSMPLDLDLSRRFAGSAVHVTRDPHVGTGISNSVLVDWGRLSTSQEQNDHPDAVVVFIGANEGFPMQGPGGRQVQCCSAQWAAIYATRARQMMNTYRHGGFDRVYWMTLPTPRDPDRQAIARTVNAAIQVAAQPWRAQVRVIDTVPIFTPGGRYRDAMKLGGQQTIVRQADGIHLNDAGSNLLAGVVLGAIGKDFTR